MRKLVNVTATYKDNVIYKLVGQTSRGDTICFMVADEMDLKHSYKYRTFKSMIKDILDFVKSNNFYINNREMFGSRCYSINLINLATGELTTDIFYNDSWLKSEYQM